MLVHIEIAARVHVEIKRAVPRDQLEHVVEKAESRCDARLSVSIQIQLHTDSRLVCLAMNRCYAWHGESFFGAGVQTGAFHSFRIVFSNSRISVCVPMVMRTNPGPMSLLRSRRRIPCFSSFWKSAGPFGPKFARRKFPALANAFTSSFSNSAANHARSRFTPLT